MQRLRLRPGSAQVAQPELEPTRRMARFDLRSVRRARKRRWPATMPAIRPRSPPAPPNRDAPHEIRIETAPRPSIVVAAADRATALPVSDVPHFAVGDHRHAHRIADCGNPFPVCRRFVALLFRSRMHHQRLCPAFSQRRRAVDRQRGIGNAEPHLGRNGNYGRYGGTHRRNNRVEQFRLAEQSRATTMPVHARRRTAKLRSMAAAKSCATRAQHWPPCRPDHYQAVAPPPACRRMFDHHGAAPGKCA